jgi:hypothetical protein
VRRQELVSAFFAQIDADLAALERDIAVVEKHCTATAAEIRAAIKEHEQALKDAEARALGALLSSRGMRVRIRRVRQPCGDCVLYPVARHPAPGCPELRDQARLLAAGCALARTRPTKMYYDSVKARPTRNRFSAISATT